MALKFLLMHGCLAGCLGQLPSPDPTSACGADRHEQAGYPRSVAWWAIPSDACGFTMYRIGGDCPLPRLAEPPRPDEGTWGWDYVGRWWHRHVILGWWHERRPETGASTYRTDGPNLNHGEASLLGHDD